MCIVQSFHCKSSCRLSRGKLRKWMEIGFQELPLNSPYRWKISRAGISADESASRGRKNHRDKRPREGIISLYFPSSFREYSPLLSRLLLRVGRVCRFIEGVLKFAKLAVKFRRDSTSGYNEDRRFGTHTINFFQKKPWSEKLVEWLRRSDSDRNMFAY